ncbi:coiled-coil domain-containing protein 187 isoform X1 [Antennarius striatus]|uniref:coiled-coil domain-containing protein 187 isoform X1 n=1 Tax=Antennarius striatus TaxID=241820 RepID=UPI0035B218B3
MPSTASSDELSSVCQCFAVLEDGALAHNLQEQEIEQYYSTNIQKNQLVQNDIRVAKRLQSEEEEQWAQQSAIIRQSSRQLEEQDFEYARIIQEEILRCAEEAQRREQDDEEIAKRMQEEEQQRIKRDSREQEDATEGSDINLEPTSPRRDTLGSLHHARDQYPSSTTRWRYSTSHNSSNADEPQADSHRGSAALRPNSWSDIRRKNSSRSVRNDIPEPSSEDSEDSDAFLAEQFSLLYKRLQERRNTAPIRRRSSLRQQRERKCRSLSSRSSYTDELGLWEEERGEGGDDYLGNSNKEKRWARAWDQESSYWEENEHRSRDQDRDRRPERQCNRSESVRSHDRSRNSNNLARTWSFKDSSDKHVRFQENPGSSIRQQGKDNSVWEMLGQVLRERGVPVRLGSSRAPLQIQLQRRDSQELHGSEVSCSDSQPHQRDFQRAATARHSFHGDIRERRRLSYRENSGRDHREDRDGRRNIGERDGEVYEISSRESYLGDERGDCRGWRGSGYTNGDTRETDVSDYRVARTTREDRHWYHTSPESVSSEQQEAERRREESRRRVPQRSQSLRCSRSSTRRRSKHTAAGASLQSDLGETSLDLRDLQQVLRDEELARKLQEEEETLLRRNSKHSPCGSHPDRDFRVAQVAQDEEIAHYMQKQEISAKRRSRELEGPASWREHRAMMSHHDRRAARDRQTVQHPNTVQRERLDSEGLPSPAEDCFPENQPPSPTSSKPQAQPIRNIAEELDPTFQARRPISETLGVGESVSTCQSLPVSHSGVRDFEEPTFIPPTKRQTDKSSRTKPKEKRENCKQQ